MTGLMACGLTLEQVVPMVTRNAARMLGREDELGTLRPGLVADVTVLHDRRGRFSLRDNGGTEVISQSERRAEINYRWVPQGNAPALGDPKDWKLVVKTPSKLIETPVKFKLENIPLP
jgi:cytosine/adenosine deaminase-related metal-dependent hydrolase